MPSNVALPLLAIEGAPAPPPSHVRRLIYLDGWRGVSILLVLLGHYAMSDAIAMMGVQMFFALSGRLMADILFVEHFPLLGFYKRRFSRVYPALVAFVISTYLLVKHTSFSFKPLAGGLALTFLLNYGIVLGMALPQLKISGRFVSKSTLIYCWVCLHFY